MPKPIEVSFGDAVLTPGEPPKSKVKYSYLATVAAGMLEDGIDAWWEDCPWCGYEGPEPPIAGLKPLPGKHEVMLCPSCKGILERDHREVSRLAADKAASKAVTEDE
jgi:hypothetical protein